MAQGSVQEYVDQSTSVLKGASGLDEQTTRTKLVDPFVRLLTGGEGVSAVWYVARVADVVDIEDADLVDDPAELIDLSDPNERRKKVIELEHDSLYELEDPIPYSKKYPQSVRYTTLEKLRNPETTDDLF